MAIMREAAREAAARLNLTIACDITVPGSMEKPLAARRLLARPDITGLCVFGVIERGETGHGLVMGQAVIKSLIELQLAFDKPMGIGILGPDILPEQIPPRLKPYAIAAVEALAAMLASK